MAQSSGVLLHNRYWLCEVLGLGATALVRKALDMNCSTVVALKFFHRGCEHSYARELAALQELTDAPHVARLLDHFSTSSGQYVLVLTFMPGGSLYDRIRPSTTALITMADIRRWLHQLCLAALQFEQRQLVHGDIKPENCLIDEQGNLVLHDLGTTVARHSQCAAETPGTHLYLAPEALACSHNNSAQDAWAIGLVLYASLFADLPWPRADNGCPSFYNYRMTGRLPLSDAQMTMMSPALRPVLWHLLAPDPEQRMSLQAAAAFFAADCNWFAPTSLSGVMVAMQPSRRVLVQQSDDAPQERHASLGTHATRASSIASPPDSPALTMEPRHPALARVQALSAQRSASTLSSTAQPIPGLPVWSWSDAPPDKASHNTLNGSEPVERIKPPPQTDAQPLLKRTVSSLSCAHSTSPQEVHLGCEPTPELDLKQEPEQPLKHLLEPQSEPKPKFKLEAEPEPHSATWSALRKLSGDPE
ncbi:uncharacterized protein MONBRDRAFT_9035 [Monosiga brevicollis MX1]|uniref:Protein kinase domain-containing protein n=1 Tax=Monosiga brevicollis TaxID=81824 RepID=A9V1W4_MONBE|nr:uncharacterized protein MONBRDRAFT_9035 [Monosiga brevicollis MX1]EDQ88514.1 predicted protein [Monosiga brevicollis MX1]|eukprot:XP_001746618.1 hypothetical protein [Monosiga brevicollis MX1]